LSAQPRDLLKFQVMTLGDLGAVSTIENRVYPYPWTLGNFSDSLSAGHECWIILNGAQTIGYAVVMIAANEAHLLNITIAPDWQGLGYGGRLLTYLIKIARAQRAEVVLLEVRPSNRTAQNLYVDFGFRAIGVRRGYYPAAIGREDAIVMELKLT
jgi:[ribosomal protein S18]-alanine N-acetyltransferase